MTDKCIKAFISGRVQGVYFRGSTRKQALRLNLTGHAINLADGRVEVLACGDTDKVEKLLNWLHRGPEYAAVNAVEVEELPAREVTGFSIA